MGLRVQQHVNARTALNTWSEWKPLDREPSAEEIEASTQNAQRMFWHDGERVHGGFAASAGAILFRIVEG